MVKSNTSLTTYSTPSKCPFLGCNKDLILSIAVDESGTPTNQPPVRFFTDGDHTFGVITDSQGMLVPYLTIATQSYTYHNT